eukprot:TRINITY_DN67817_c4_g4_i25.p1 TRINITY_DN67817_c4_g4~~TRINITY_DN67817_c4_g4_i25.p1  ORF type:complete len:351 (+),score=5.55 TRINITY_DN67817_c4_g4_i25:480-1532(+)
MHQVTRLAVGLIAEKTQELSDFSELKEFVNKVGKGNNKFKLLVDLKLFLVVTKFVGTHKSLQACPLCHTSFVGNREGMWETLGGLREWQCLFDLTEEQVAYCTSHASAYWHSWCLHNLIPTLRDAPCVPQVSAIAKLHKFPLADTVEVKRGAKGQKVESKLKWKEMHELWYNCVDITEVVEPAPFLLKLFCLLPTTPKVKLGVGSVWAKMVRHVAKCEAEYSSAWVLWLSIVWCITDALLHQPALFTLVELANHSVYQYLHNLVQQLGVPTTRNSWPMHHVICHPKAWDSEQVRGFTAQYGESEHNWLRYYCAKHPHWYFSNCLMQSFKEMLVYPVLPDGIEGPEPVGSK